MGKDVSSLSYNNALITLGKKWAVSHVVNHWAEENKLTYYISNIKTTENFFLIKKWIRYNHKGTTDWIFDGNTLLGAGRAQLYANIAEWMNQTFHPVQISLVEWSKECNPLSAYFTNRTGSRW